MIQIDFINSLSVGSRQERTSSSILQIRENIKNDRNKCVIMHGDQYEYICDK